MRKHTLLLFIILPLAIVAGIVFIAAFSGSFRLAGEETAVGEHEKRSNANPPASYTVKKGETIYDVADGLGIPYFDLVIENRLTGELPLDEGRKLAVPRFDPRARPEWPPAAISIRATASEGPAPLAVHLEAEFDFTKPGRKFVWDLGNNRFSFQARPRVLYTRPGVYRARLLTSDGAGRYRSSNTVEITATDIEAEYDGLPFLTAERVGDLVDVAGRLKNPSGAVTEFDETAAITQSPELVDYFGRNKLVARRGGFSRVRLEKRGHVFEFYLFVSPLPARLSAEPEYDWYKTQFETGMYGNCGPAAVGSAIKWATGEDLTVPKIREEIGMPYPNGAVDHFNLLANLERHKVIARVEPYKSMHDLLRVIDHGGLVIVSFNCGSLTHTTRDKVTDFFDRYYPDATGHYLLIKGYTLDRNYFIVYDAIPGEWKKNEPRYLDGVSMIGRNRFFLISEVMAGISTRNMLVVYRTRPVD